MTNENAKRFISEIFFKIKESNNIQNLEEIEKSNFEEKEKMNIEKYPKIKFSILPNEIKLLQEKGILEKDYSFSEAVSSKIEDPLTKLLYALAWKNGDLIKMKHIVKGVYEEDSDIANQEKALVFYQFGRYLTKKNAQPIVDQHVLRAFEVYNSKDSKVIEKYRRMNTIGKKESTSVKAYIDWLSSDELTKEMKSHVDYNYYIDRILFAAGRKIKMKKSRR